MDVIFGTNMQKSGLIDTMGDLIVDTVGGLIVAVIGYFTLRDNRKNRLHDAIEDFMEKNPAMEKRIDEQRDSKNSGDDTSGNKP